MGNTDFKIEPLSIEHLEGLVHLYEAVFDKVEHGDYFRIKYGVGIVNQYSLVLLKEKKVVGFVGIIPQVFSKGDDELKMAYFGDFILLKEFRGQGIFDKLIEFSHEKLINDDYAYLYAFQSEQTFKVCQKANWIPEKQLVRFQLNVLPKPIGGIVSKLGLSNSVKGKLVKNLLSYEIDSAHGLERSGDYWSILPNKEFLAMKGFGSRHFVEIEGCKMWLKFDYRISVGFVTIGSQSDLSKMFATLKSIARKSGVFEIVFHFIPDSVEAKAFAKCLDQKDSFKLSYLPLKAELPRFSDIHLDFMNGDMF